MPGSRQYAIRNHSQKCTVNGKGNSCLKWPIHVVCRVYISTSNMLRLLLSVDKTMISFWGGRERLFQLLSVITLLPVYVLPSCW